MSITALSSRSPPIDAANEFEQENPTHARVDYCLYMKGLIYFDGAPNFLERMFRVDMSERPPRDTLLAFATLDELIRRFPESEYIPDARQRMVFLRNRLAEYENHVASYYIDRGAYVAAVNRAKYAVEHYPGAPALEDSLTLMARGLFAAGPVRPGRRCPARIQCQLRGASATGNAWPGGDPGSRSGGIR